MMTPVFPDSTDNTTQPSLKRKIALHLIGSDKLRNKCFQMDCFLILLNILMLKKGNQGTRITSHTKSSVRYQNDPISPVTE